MLRKSVVLAAVVSLLIAVPFSQAFAAKPPRNDAPVVTQFEVEPASPSPVPILTFTADDNDGSVVGYCVTESSSAPSVGDSCWVLPAPTSYTTASVGLVTLYGWAKDNEDAVSDPLSDTVDIPDPQDQIIADLQAAVAALQADNAYLMDLLQHFSRVGNEVVITGANLNVVSGSGATDGAVNGLGNLVVGYNELPASPADPLNDRTGSHNVIVGSQLGFGSYGGLVLGLRNYVTGIYSSITGGYKNEVTGGYSSITGGSWNKVPGYMCSANGGSNNTADGGNSSILGGSYNATATSAYNATVGGGGVNIASGEISTVSGGHMNTAVGQASSVSGGYGRTAPGVNDWVAGTLFEEE